jgi:crotonobetainyl-CoA:carnitine CoA-transferase CaiB-like acyl-CoA transferase
MFEAMLITQNPYGYLFTQLGAPSESGSARFVETPSVEPAKDGYVGFCTVTAQQFQDFLVLIERPDLLDDVELATAAGRRRRRAEFLAAVHAWTTVRTTAEILDAAEALRIPAVPVAAQGDIADLPHFRERGVLVGNPHGFRQPRVPYRIDGVAERPVGRVEAADAAAHVPVWRPRAPRPRRAPNSAAVGLPLRGIRVVDLTAFWAGPSATQLLAVLGAEVIKVESVRRPDPMRFTTARRDADNWWEYGPVFHGANTGKLGVTLHLTREQGRELFGRLVAGADVVVENFTPRVLDQLRIGPAQLHAWNPAALVVRMPAFGLDGPWRDRPGFAQTMEQVGGLAWVTGEPGHPPMLPKASDPIAGVHAVVATLAGLEHRDRTGRGTVVEVPMIETVLNVGAESIVEHSAYGRTAGRHGNRGAHATPQGVYACAGTEQWLALSVETDGQWRALRSVIDLPDLPDADERVRLHDRLDARLAAWFAARDRDTAVADLLRAGVPAAPVVPPSLAATHATTQPAMAARGFLERLDHPVGGPLDLPGPPFRFASRGAEGWLGKPAPTLGHDNEAVLTGLLGLTAEELEALRTDGVAEHGAKSTWRSTKQHTGIRIRKGSP